jgi:aryl-alcohol dehydrogenase-like predicted oxidoreductase
MEYVRFGASSLKVSRIAFGLMGVGDPGWRSWVLPKETAQPLFRQALDAGINIFDTCDFYSAGRSEEILGELIKEDGVRNEVVIATKVGNPMGRGPNSSGYSRKHIIEAAEASLRRLQTDHIDLYQTHIWDPSTNIEEMVLAFDQLHREGKVLYVGATDIPCWQMAKAVYLARQLGLVAFSSIQHHYNAVWREDERELIPFARSEGLALLPYSPIARGFLAGSDRRQQRTTERARTDDYAWSWYSRSEDGHVADAIEQLATGKGVSPSQVALAWVLHNSPGAVPIVGATSQHQLDEAIQALGIGLTAEECKLISDAYHPRPHGGHF